MIAQPAAAPRPFDLTGGVREDLASGLLVLPGDATHAFTYAEWGDDWRSMRRLVLEVTSKRTQPVWVPDPEDAEDWQLAIPVVLELVPRPDNEYNPEAVAVAMPPKFGGGVLERHLGYMYERHLYHHGAAIRRLSEHTGRGVGVHAWIELIDFAAIAEARDRAAKNGDPSRWSASDRWISGTVAKEVAAELADEPSTESRLDEDSRFTASELRSFGYWVGRVRYPLAFAPGTDEAVEAHIASHPVRLQGGLDLRREWHQRFVRVASRAIAHRAATGAWGRSTRRQAAADERQARALASVVAWDAWRVQPSAFWRLHARTRAVFGRLDVVVLDDAGVQVGKVQRGVLTLIDERCRPAAVEAVMEHAGPGVLPVVNLAGLGQFPDATLASAGPGWVIAAVVEGGRNLGPLGWVDPDDGRAFLLAPAHQRPVEVLLERHGIHVERVAVSDMTGLPDWVGIERAEDSEAVVAEADDRITLRAEHRALIPENVQGSVPIRFLHGGDTSRDVLGWEDLRDEDGRVREWYLASSQELLERGRCRLCGSRALAPSGAPAYCRRCINRSTSGVLVDRGFDEAWFEATLWALRTLATQEFSGPPSAAQLDHAPAPGTLADLGVVCRMLVPRGSRLPVRYQRKPLSLTEWLAAAGLLDDGVATPRGTRTIASDGHACRSLLERHVDDFLAHHGVYHDIEPAWPLHDRWNRTGLRADWQLLDGTMVEAFGLEGDGAYDAKVERKRALAAELGVRLVEVRSVDLGRLRHVFADWL